MVKNSYILANIYNFRTIKGDSKSWGMTSAAVQFHWYENLYQHEETKDCYIVGTSMKLNNKIFKRIN